jgi:hypothetical protein
MCQSPKPPSKPPQTYFSLLFDKLSPYFSNTYN